MLFFTRPIDSSRKKFIENNVRPKKGKETKSESAIRVASETKLQQNTYEQISALIYFKSCIVTGKLHVLPSYLPVLFANCSYKHTYILSACKPNRVMLIGMSQRKYFAFYFSIPFIHFNRMREREKRILWWNVP